MGMVYRASSAQTAKCLACGVCDGDGSSCAPPREGFVLIEAGTFTMGSPPGEPGRGGYETSMVTLTSGFYMSDHEITQAEWQALIDNNPSSANNGTCPTCPVESVKVRRFFMPMR